MDASIYYNIYYNQKGKTESPIKRLKPEKQSDDKPKPRKRKRLLHRPPETPDPRRLNLSKRNEELLRYHPYFGPKHSFDDFKEIRPLGRGRFGQTFLVRDASNEISVLKKSILPIIGVSDLEQCRKQCEILSRFCCLYPNLLQHHSAWVEKGYLYVHTAYYPLGDLETQLDSKQCTKESDMWDCLRHLAGGLQVIHSMGLVHRDLKAKNIFIDENGRHIIGDFGHMTWTRKPSSCDLDSRYMPMEALGETVTPECDIFSLGLLMLEYISDEELPKSGARWTELRAAKNIFANVNFEVSEKAKQCILGMLHPDPAGRPSALELVRMIATMNKEES